MSSVQSIIIRPEENQPLSPYIFGHNLEHTRSCLTDGLSAQMLRNRKFAGKPSRNQGCAAEWFAIGRRGFYQNDLASYTRHVEPGKMPRRNELNVLDIQNLLPGDACGVGQNGLCVKEKTRYELRVTARAEQPLALTVRLTDRTGASVYAEETRRWDAGDWHTERFTLCPAATDSEACLRLTFPEQARLTLGAVSLMPEDNFHGMRRDVVEALKAIGPSIIRWPGGNFAGEYRWKDGLLDADERGPLESVMETETQPFSHGYDNHEINTDDFIALCRKVGAEPFVTINLVWDSPKDCADWVDYCNGDETTEWGRRRIERGHAEPYNVRFWSLGNEMGFGHMEGPMTPAAYTEPARSHAEAMKQADPLIELFISGPYPNKDWAEQSAKPMANIAPFVSLHCYSGAPFDYTTPENTEATCRFMLNGIENSRKAIRQTRAMLTEDSHISFDEWNAWYAWYRPSSVVEGLFAAGMLHMMLSESPISDMPVCCYFQPVNEGAMIAHPDGTTELTAIGQAFELMKAHRGGRLCRLDGVDDDSAAATLNGQTLTVTLINFNLHDEKTVCVRTAAENAVLTESALLTAEDALPYSRFAPMPADVSAAQDGFSLTLPPHSLARLTFTI